MKTKSKEQLIHEAILNDKEIHNLQYIKYKIYQTLPHLLVYNLDKCSVENINTNNYPDITEINEHIRFRIKQIKQYYEN